MFLKKSVDTFREERGETTNRCRPNRGCNFREHGRKSDDVAIAWNSIDCLGDWQALHEQARVCIERPEAVEAGTVKLVGTSTGRIVTTANEILDDSTIYAAMSAKHNPYGDGHACERIIETLSAEN